MHKLFRSAITGLGLGAMLAMVGACSPSADQQAATPEDSAEAATAANAVHPGAEVYQTYCASCHDGAVAKAPRKDMIGLMTPGAIEATMTTGIMQPQAATLTAEQRRAVSEFLAFDSSEAATTDIAQCGPDVQFDALQGALGQNWGITPDNQRAIPAATAGINDPQTLTPRWAIAFPGANRVRSQPAFAGGLIFVGSHNGKLYALDPKQGCQVWATQTAAEIRTAIVVAPWSDTQTTTRLYFGDVLGNVYGVDARTGTIEWRVRADDHPNATITGSPSLADGKLFVPVSSLEVALAVDPAYECCTFRGSVLAVDAASGERLWHTYTIDQPATVQSQNASGTDMYGPSGAVVWNSPSVDTRRGQIYFGTGENMSSPATLTSDALFALDMQTGEVNWIFQATPNDAWNVACDTPTPDSCPEEDGPDFDFGGATLIASTSEQGDLVIAGQKSGLVHALNPDTGKLVWQTRVGRGGIQGGIHFGIAAEGDRVFVPISDMPDGRQYPDPDRPGMHALDANTGAILWSTVHDNVCNGRDYCDPGISQVPTVIGDHVYAGGMDGVLRAYAKDTGKVVWQLDTTQPFTTPGGHTTRGGSFSGGAGPVAFQGGLLVSSGYGIYNHMAGNLLLMLEEG